MARFCAEHSYQQGLAQFHEVLRPDGRELVSMNKAFEMVRAVADGLEEQRQREMAERADEPVAVREEITGTMVVGIDAGKVATRANERVTEDGKKSYDRVFRDSKVATVSAVKVDREGAAHCTKTSCVTGVEAGAEGKERSALVTTHEETGVEMEPHMPAMPGAPPIRGPRQPRRCPRWPAST